MGNKKDNKNKTTITGNDNKVGKLKTAINGETGHFIGGLICLMFGVYLFLAFTSFISAGGADQSILTGNAADSTETIQNHTGPAGARLAEFFINGCFGFPSYFMVVIFLIAGTNLMKAYDFKVWKWFVGSMTIMYWMSIALGFIFNNLFENSFIYPGGMHGYNVSLWLESMIGAPGVFLCILATGIIIGVIIRRETMDVVRKALHPSFIKIGEKAIPENAAEEVFKEEASNAEMYCDDDIAERTEEAEKDNKEEETEKPIKAKWYEKFVPGGLLGRLFGKKKADKVDENIGNSDDKGNDGSANSNIAADDMSSVAKNYTYEEKNHEADVVRPVITEPKETVVRPSTYDNANDEVDEDDMDDEGITPDEKEDNSIELSLDDNINDNVNMGRQYGKPMEKPGRQGMTADKANEEPAFEIESVKEETVDNRGNINIPYNPRLDLELYKFPTLDLLKTYPDEGPSIDMEEQNANKNRIIQVLRSFGIEISSIKANVGPTITLYEITPAEGVRISKIRNLEDDIALSLSALGIRIIAPIPGKGTIGIEVPNASPKIVPMSIVLASKKFQETTYDLPVALGKTITNEVFMVDLAKAPHMLVAGATGQGKSVGLNAIVTSLLYKKHPSELKFVIIDPKKVEFAIYAPIEKHFLAKLPDGDDAIITDVTKVVQTLNSLCVEMDSRYDLLKKAGCRNIKEYNAKFINRQLNPENGHRFMPYIVIIIDEFGDLIMTAGKEVELPICRIAQLARAVGIHAIIATQRPTTNIITGTIKANFPARVAFRVASMMDSRTILDRPGAQQLIGKGDMLYLQGNDPVRVQCAFVDTPEVEKIAEYISRQQGYPTAFMLPEYVDENADAGGAADVDMNRLDPMFEEAARLIIYHQQGSTSLIQRKLSLGYNRAGRIMDQLERAGIVGPANGSKARDVICISEEDLQMRLSALRNN